MNYQHYQQVQPERGIESNFSSGQINYKFKMAERSWNPSKSYFKIRMKITKGDGSRLDTNFGLAPNFHCCDNLFQQINMSINGTSVSHSYNYVAQTATLKTRLYKDLNEREALLSSVNYGQIRLDQRINQVAYDGYKTLNSERVQFVDLMQTDGVQILRTEDIRVLIGALNVLEYRNAGGAGDGAIDLTQTALKVGDFIEINNYLGVVYFTAQITAIAAKNITLDRDLPAAAASAAIGGNQIFHLPSYYDSKQSQQANDIEMIWVPKIGFFDINDWMIGDYKLELTPHQSGIWEKYAVECLTDRAVGTGVDDYQIEIKQLNMYIWTNVSNTPVSGPKSYTYTDIECHSQNLTTNSLTSKVFTTHENSYAYTLAFQESAAGDDIRFSRSKFKIQNNEELNLVRYYLNKDGLQLPDPIPSLEKNQSDGIDNMTQRYYENFAYSHGDELLLKKETLDDWYDAGVFFNYKWGKGGHKSNTMTVYTNFSQAFTTNPQILLFDHYYCNLSMNVVNGEVTSVIVK